MVERLEVSRAPEPKSVIKQPLREQMRQPGRARRPDAAPGARQGRGCDIPRSGPRRQHPRGVSRRPYRLAQPERMDEARLNVERESDQLRRHPLHTASRWVTFPDDEVVTLPQALAAKSLCRETSVAVRVVPGRHLSLFMGRKTLDGAWREIACWLRQRTARGPSLPDVVAGPSQCRQALLQDDDGIGARQPHSGRRRLRPIRRRVRE